MSIINKTAGGFLSILLFSFFITCVLAASGFRLHKQVPDGKQLFQSQCGACHHTNKAITGPPFQRIREFHSLEKLTQFIRYPLPFFKNDSAFRVTYFSYYRYAHLAYPNMKQAELKAILDYVDSKPYDPNSSGYAHRRLTSAQRDSLFRDTSRTMKIEFVEPGK